MTDSHPPIGDVDARQTHLSQLYFSPDRVFKLLKPVATPFVSFVDTNDRMVAATREFDLNYRFAPDVYLGTADVEEGGDVVDRMIVMRRLPEDRQLDRIVVEGPDPTRWVREAAKHVAVIHAAEPAVRGDDAWMAGPDAVLGRWRENFESLQPLAGPVIPEREFNDVVEYVERYVRGRQVLFDERIAQGWVRDGHGDLRAEHVFCEDDGPRLIDCLAFRDDYRIGDVLNDVAFLAMDLNRLAGPELATAFVHDYCEFSNEHHSSTLAHHYVAYRANVRAKVAAIRLAQGDDSALEELTDYHQLAWSHLVVGQVRLVLIGGGVGVGKSTVAERLASRLGATWLRTDEVRKAGAQRSTEGRAVSDEAISYDQSAQDAVYREMLAEAETLLVRGESVVLDATWSGPERRDWARDLASRTAALLSEVRLDAPLDVAVARVGQRRDLGVDPSDVTPELVGRLHRDFAPWPEALVINTDQSIKTTVGDAWTAVIAGRRTPSHPAPLSTVHVDRGAVLNYQTIRFYLSRATNLVPPLTDDNP